MGLTKLGPNALTLSATNNTYNGGTVVSVGVLAVTNTGALPGYSTASKIAVNSGATLAMSVGGSGWTAGNIGSLLSSNSSGFTLGSALGIDTTNGSFSYGAIAGNMGLTKLGANTLTLTAASTFGGATTVSGGTLDLAAGSALQNSTLIAPTAGSICFDSGVSPASFTFGGLSGPGNITLRNSAGTAVALTVGGNNSNTLYSGMLGGSGSLTKVGTSVLALAGSNTFTGGTTISGGTLQFGDGISGQDGSLVSAGGITDNAALVFNLAGSEVYSGTITGSGSLTKTSGGTLTLSGTNNGYTGGTVVSGGELAVTNTGGLSNYNVASKLAVNKGAMLSLSVGSAGWTGSNIANLLSVNGGSFASGSALGIDTTIAGTGGFSYSSAIAGSMGVTMLGPNTLTLSATNNSYTGGTIVSGSELAVTNSGALPGYNITSRVTVNSGGMLVLSVGGQGGLPTTSPPSLPPTAADLPPARRSASTPPMRRRVSPAARSPATRA